MFACLTVYSHQPVMRSTLMLQDKNLACYITISFISDNCQDLLADLRITNYKENEAHNFMKNTVYFESDN